MNGVPRLLVIDYRAYSGEYMIHFAEAKNTFETKYSGLNNQSIAGYGAEIVRMDFSLIAERAFEQTAKLCLYKVMCTYRREGISLL